jgi:hypothetical protein
VRAQRRGNLCVYRYQTCVVEQRLTPKKVKSTIYILLTLLKAVIIITGMVYMFLNFISWRKTNDSKKLKKVAIIFGGIFLSLLIITCIEFIIALN